MRYSLGPSNQINRILAAIRESDFPLTAKELVSITDLPQRHIQSYLVVLEKAGRVKKAGKVNYPGRGRTMFRFEAVKSKKAPIKT